MKRVLSAEIGIAFNVKKDTNEENSEANQARHTPQEYLPSRNCRFARTNTNALKKLRSTSLIALPFSNDKILLEKNLIQRKPHKSIAEAHHFLLDGVDLDDFCSAR